MFVAMNRFRVNEGFEEGFETVWRTRQRLVNGEPGFITFSLLRGETAAAITPYISHSVWASKQAFVDWTNSEAFVNAHRDARSPQGTLDGHPEYAGYEVVDTDEPVPAG
jgi:heme-degrading monooxygenase HmoA